ncbi:MAG: hypothetical protein AAFS02_06705 [Pseudomonadota bacterium]
MQILPAAMATLAIILMFTAAHAEPTPEAQAAIAERLSQTAEALELTDSQRESFAAVLETQLLAQRDLLVSYGIDPTDAAEGLAELGRGDRRELRKALDALRRETTDALSDVLSEEQLETFSELEAERQAAQRAEIRDRMRGRF